MSAPDGRVVISTALDNNGIKSGINNIKGNLGGLKDVLKGVGAAVAAAFTVRAIAGFAKECIELGSAVAEVQNVVDTAFGSMTYKMEDFAKTAITSYGMSELAAKETGSTYMAMAKGMGVAEAAASDMAIQLTALSGDVASFFNMDQAEVASKLRSVFTGETEALKQLGVVMTQTNLQAFALSHGMNGNITAMTQAEQVALRYAFVTDALKLASGDFVRTQDSWANQTRILSMQWQQLMAVIGQGLTNVLLPVVRVMNSIVAAILQAANAISAAFSSIMGGSRKEFSAASNGADGLADANSGIGSSAADAAEGEQALADGTKKAANEAKKAVASFDEITQLQSPADTSAGSSAGNGASGASGSGISEQVVDTGEVEGALSALQKAMDALRESFLQGLAIGWGDAGAGVDAIKSDLASIRESLIRIWTDPAVTGSAESFALTVSKALGEVTGSVASVGVSIAENLVGGIARYLESSGAFLSQTLANVFDAGSILATLTGDFAASVATVFRSLGSDGAKQITAGFIGTFASSAAGMAQTAAQTLTLIFLPALQPIIDNADKIRLAFENVAEVVAPLFEGLAEGVEMVYTSLNDLYQNVLLPIAETVAGELSEALGGALDKLNEFLSSITGAAEPLKTIGQLAGTLIGGVTAVLTVMKTVSAISSIFSGISTAIGTIGAVMGTAFSALLSPITPVVAAIAAAVAIGVLLYQNWDQICQVVSNFIAQSPLLTSMMETLKMAGEALSNLGGILANIWTTIVQPFLQSMIEMLLQLWEQHLQPMFASIGEMLVSLGALIGTILGQIINVVMGVVNTIIQVVLQLWNNVLAPLVDFIVSAFGPLISSIFTAVGQVIGTFVGFVADCIKTATDVFKGILDFLTAIFQGNWSAAWEAVKNTVITLWQNIQSTVGSLVQGLFTAISTIWNGIKTTVSNVVQAIWQTVTSVWNNICNAVSSALQGLMNIFSSIWNGIVNIVAGAVSAVSGFISNIIGAVQSAINAVAGLFSFFGGSGGSGSSGGTQTRAISGGFYVGALPEVAYTPPRVKIPALATGAVIPANKEFLALMGDQKHGTNIETPESLLRKIVREEIGSANTNTNSETLQALRSIQALLRQGQVLVVDKKVLARSAVQGINDMTIAAGKSVLIL